MTVEALKNVITALPQEQRHALASWLNELEYDAWDKQMVADFSPGGRGTVLADIVKREIAQGKTVPLRQELDRVKAQRQRSGK